MATQSIATRLFLAASAWSVTILLVAGLLLSAIYRRTAEQAFDQQLGVYLRALAADVAAPSDEKATIGDELSQPDFEVALSGWYWQITRLDGDDPQIQSSRSLFAARLPRLADAGVRAGVGGSRSGYAIGPDDRRLRIDERVIDTIDSGVYLVQVAATTEDIEAEIFHFNLALIATFLVLGLSLVGMIALQVRYGLRPLRLLQDQVASIRRGTSERIVGSFSDDLRPLASEVNLLIVSNREIVERARTQVGNLAHALKTPLSVITNEARIEASPLAEKVCEQAGIMSDQVTYYLDRARAAARSGVIGSVTEVRPAIDGLVRTFEKIHRDRAIAFTVDVPEQLSFRGERQDLEEMIGNLVDNAAKWARSTVGVKVETSADSTLDRSLLVEVEDDGPGLPEASRAAALKRGRRLDESKPGSGLGLSIVVDLASVYGGTLTLDDGPQGGLRASLRLPAV
ncbi:MAG TPA: ATP-binding protein [Beijerinckiaceae bacterium]|jgi:signal transduction histidine kinase|nr:ATP-binding protein [Beijerinckiaceae bacterium]